jgi:transposase
MDVFVHRCAGFDVHRDTVVATVRVPGPGRRRRVQHTRTFATTTAGIAALGDWLAEHRVTRAGMESTGVYWKLLPAGGPARGVVDQRRAPA